MIFVIISIIALIGCIIWTLKLIDEKKFLQRQYNKLLSQKKSSEILLGHTAEKLAPLTKAFDNYNIRDTTFIGMPIDYICFGEDEITFLEVKSGNSQLTTKQKKIKKLVQDKKIKWDTVRISGDSR